MGGTDLRVVNRIAFVSGLAMIVVGGLGSLASLVSIWQGQAQIANHSLSSGSIAGEAPTIADRITVGLQFGGLFLFFAILVLGAGIALVLASRHLPDQRTDPGTEPADRWPEPPVVEVPLEVEARAWAPMTPRPDEDPLRH